MHIIIITKLTVWKEKCPGNKRFLPFKFLKLQNYKQSQ